MFIQPEEVTLPLRFLLKTAHFIAVLTVVFDIDNVVTNITQVDYRTATGSALDDFNSTKNTVKGMAYASLATFGIEYITLFMGVTIFMRPLNGLNILAHGIGLIMTILFYVDNWNLASFAAFSVVFCYAPCVLELLCLFFVSKFAFLKY